MESQYFNHVLQGFVYCTYNVCPSKNEAENSWRQRSHHWLHHWPATHGAESDDKVLAV